MPMRMLQLLVDVVAVRGNQGINQSKRHLSRTPDPFGYKLLHAGSNTHLPLKHLEFGRMAAAVLPRHLVFFLGVAAILAAWDTAGSTTSTIRASWTA